MFDRTGSTVAALLAARMLATHASLASRRKRLLTTSSPCIRCVLNVNAIFFA